MNNNKVNRRSKNYLTAFTALVMTALIFMLISKVIVSNADNIAAATVSSWNEFVALADNAEMMSIENGVLIDDDNDETTEKQSYNVYTLKKSINVSATLYLPEGDNIKICAQADEDGNPEIFMKSSGTFTDLIKRENVAGMFILENIILDGNSTTNGICYYEGTILSSNLIFKNFVTSSALVIGHDAEAKLNNCTFESNEAKGVSVYRNAKLTASNCVFKNNEGDFGGAIYLEGNSESEIAKAEIYNCEFKSNNATIHGGAIFTTNYSEADVEESEFNSNTATKCGGAFYCEYGSEIYINDSNFESNTSDELGGAILGQNLAKDFEITNSEFENNTAPFGGAIIIVGAINATISDSIFSENEAYFGGAIAMQDAQNFIINGCSIQENASAIGGGLNISNCPAVQIDDCKFIENEVITKSEPLEFAGYTFEGDFGGIGAAIYSVYSAVSLKDSEVTGNVSENYGAIVNSFNDLDIINSKIRYNKAESGGAISSPEGQSYLGILKGTDIPFNESGKYTNTKGEELTGYYNDIALSNVQRAMKVNAPATQLAREPYIYMYEYGGDGSNDFDPSAVTGKIAVSLIPAYADSVIAIFNEETLPDESPFILLDFDEDTKVLSINEKDELRNKDLGETVFTYLSKNINYVFDDTCVDTSDKSYSAAGTTLTFNNTTKQIQDKSFYYYMYSTKIDSANIVNIPETFKINEDYKVKKYVNNDKAGMAKVIIEGIDKMSLASASDAEANFIKSYFGEREIEFKIICNLSALTADNVSVIKSEDSKWGYKVSAGGRVLNDEEYEIEITSENETSVTMNVKAAPTAEFYTGEITGLVVEAPPIIEYKETATDGQTEVTLSNLKDKVNVDIADIRQENINVALIKAVVKSGITLEASLEEKIKEINQKVEEKTKLDTYDIHVIRCDDGTAVGKQQLFDSVLVTLKLPKEKGYEYKDFEIYHGIDTDGDNTEDDVEKLPLESIVDNTNDISINFYTNSLSTFTVYSEKTLTLTEDDNNSGSGGSSSGESSSSSVTTTQTVTVKTIDHESIMNGYKDNTFRPSKTVTRNEIAAILSRLDENYSDNTSYDYYLEGVVDVPQSTWSRNYLGYMRKLNVITGTQSLMNPNGEVTRAELAKIICYYKNLNSEGKTSKFADANGRWYDKYVATLSELGWIEGYSNGTFAGTGKVTRAELCKILCLMTDREIKDTNKITQSIKTALAKKFTDINDTSWYYPYVVELTYDHTNTELH